MIGRLSELDPGARAKIDSACNYINAEVSKVRNRILTFAGVIVALGIIVGAVLWSHGVRDLRIVVFPSLALVGIFGVWQWRAVNKQFKQIVVTRVVNALGSGMTYSPTSRFTREDFINMDLYSRRIENWRAEDEVAGRKNAVTYTILEGKGTRTEGSGKNRRTVVIFRGTIARLDFNKNFFGHTVVVPDGDGTWFGGLLGEASSRGQKELCRLENPTFEERYSVYSTDQQEARYILTPKMMDLVLEASGALPKLRISFQDNSVFITIPSSRNRFEIRGFFGGRVTPESVVGELFEVVDLAERLIDTLDLETRIWSRV